MSQEYLKHISPFIRYANDGCIDGPYELNRVIFDYELLYIQEGECHIIIENRKYTGQAGDVFIFRPGIPHTVKIDAHQRIKQPHIHFDFFYDEFSEETPICFDAKESIPDNLLHLFREDINVKHNANIADHYHIKNEAHFKYLMSQLVATYNSKLPLSQSELKGQFIQLWTYLMVEQYYEKANIHEKDRQLIMDIKEYMDTHLQESITLDQLAQEFAINKFTLIRLFKATFNSSPIQYYNAQRIRVAVELLRYSNWTITEIADYLGYANIHAFSRAFKNATKVPPTAFK